MARTNTNTADADIGGSIALGQVAYGSGADTIQGSALFTIDPGTGVTTLQNLGAGNNGIVISDSNGVLSSQVGSAGGVVQFDSLLGPFVATTLTDSTDISSIGISGRTLYDEAGTEAVEWDSNGLTTINSVIVPGTAGATIEYQGTTAAPATSVLAVPANIDVFGSTAKLLGEPAGWILIETPGGTKKQPYYDL